MISLYLLVTYRSRATSRTYVGKYPSLRLLQDLAGAEHVMLGSDFVWEPMSGGLRDVVAHVRPDSAQIGCICSGTAQKFLKR